MEDRHQNPRNESERRPEVRLEVAAGTLPFFTTLLQWGVEMETTAGIPLLDFLCGCPGFAESYLLETVQTVFLNGTAVDDLKAPLVGEHPVVALSAAMPGLAGAIFRKNSIHSGLRTPPSPAPAGSTIGRVTVALKLFNRVARDRGELLLSSGVVMAAASLSSFLAGRPELAGSIKRAMVDAGMVHPCDLPDLMQRHEWVTLFIAAWDAEI